VRSKRLIGEEFASFQPFAILHYQTTPYETGLCTGFFVFGPMLEWYYAEVNLTGDEVFLGLVQIFQDHPVPPLIGSKTRLFGLHEPLDRPKCSGREDILYSACPTSVLSVFISSPGPLSPVNC
jgi:hypothetical protein